MSVTVNFDMRKVYQFVSNPEILLKWVTTFILSIRKAKSEWIMEPKQGLMKVQFAEKND